MTLRTRIAAVAGVAVAVAVLSAAAVVYVAVRSNLRGEVQRDLQRRALALADPRDRGPGGGPPRHGGPLGPGRGRRAPDRFGGAAGLVQVIDGAGNASPPTVPVSERARRLVASRRAGTVTSDAEVQGVHVMVVAAARPDGTGVQVARPLTEVDSALRNVLAVLAGVGAGGIALAILLGLLVARSALAPIARFTRRTEEIAGRPEALSERMEVAGRDELARLAASFNTALDALERSVETQRQLVADAGHELRTPIASLRANFQTLEEADRLPKAELDALRADILSELDELTALVGDVVELARGTRPGEALDDVRLDEIVRALVERAERRGDKTVRYVTRLEPTLVRGDGERIGRAVSNLLDNARKWSPSGGEVDVSLRDGVLMVRDHGPGFDEQDLPRVFERFHRSAAARAMPGSGLGLSIVRQAAEAHGGWAQAANAAGGGAILRVCFGPPVRR